MSAKPGEESVDRLHLGMLLLAVAIGAACWLLSGLLAFPAGRDPAPGRWALAITGLTTACWLLRSLSLGAASLLPMVLLPLLGVQTTRRACEAYADPILWMFFGGFVIALAIERSGLHRRLALHVIHHLGTQPRRLALGFVLAAILISMWINNTATTLMLLPVCWAIVRAVEQEGLLHRQEARRFGAAMMLAIAYGSSIGGIGTPIGTAPNLLFFSSYAPLERDGAPAFLFVDWMLAFVPFALGFGCLTWFLLAWVLFPLPRLPGEAGKALLAEVTKLEPMSAAERRTLLLFLLAVLLWITRGDVRLGADHVVQGWASRLFGNDKDVLDGTVAVAVGVLMFAVPSGRGDGQGLIDWAAARQMPWAILFLLGGGVAIANAFEDTGLSLALGSELAPAIAGLHPFVAIALVTAMLTLLTELASNTAITALMLPLLLAAARAADVDPRLWMLPATIAASCGFALPIGTPPNAIVFSTGRVSFGEMARAGILLDLLSAFVLTLVFWFWALPVLGIDPYARPTWLK